MLKYDIDDDFENKSRTATQFDDIITEDDETRKNYKRILADIEDGGVDLESDAKRSKRIMLCLTKPSYTLGLGNDNLRCEHRRRLGFLLRKLVRQHNWIEASGVLSVLLKATCKDRSPENNRMKYSALMEVLDHVESGHINTNRIKHIYDVWMRRIGSSKKSSSKDRLTVHLEFILFCLTQGNVEDAHQAALSITQEPQFGKHFMSNMLLGLTFYELWYNGIPKEMQLTDPEQLHTSSPSRSLLDSFNTPAGNSHGDEAVYSHEASTMAHYDSDTSVMKDKQISVDSHAEEHVEIVPKNEPYTEEGELQQNIQSQGFYMHSADIESLSGDGKNMHDAGEELGVSYFPYLDGLDSWLLPIQLPQNLENHLYLVQLQRKILNDYYKDTVKYFRLALESSPQTSDALLPLTQLLLIGGQIDEAVRMLENFCLNANTAFPFRLLATLLERFDRKNHPMLSSCHENILKNDPTCSHAVARLIFLHQHGYYTVESLVEMIALHLDATFAESNAWRELASCFLKLSQLEEDRMSVCVNGSEGGLRQQFSARFNRAPKLFSEGSSGNSWRFRSRLWQSLHFRPGILESEISAGDLQLLTYKAACAAHMYQPGFEYTVKVYDSLVKENDCERANNVTDIELLLVFQGDPLMILKLLWTEMHSSSYCIGTWLRGLHLHELLQCLRGQAMWRRYIHLVVYLSGEDESISKYNGQVFPPSITIAWKKLVCPNKQNRAFCIPKYVGALVLASGASNKHYGKIFSVLTVNFQSWKIALRKCKVKVNL